MHYDFVVAKAQPILDFFGRMLTLIDTFWGSEDAINIV
jgi:hypothetical protein